MRSLVANMLFPPMIAHLALHLAAPHKLALALLLDISYSRLVAASAAQQTAAVDAVRCPIAQAATRAHDAQTGARDK